MSPAWDDMAMVGRIARAHGNRGEVIVDPETDFPEERYKPGSVVFVVRNSAVEPLTITTSRFHRGRPIIGIEGVETMTAAEALAGAELRVDPATLQPLPAGAFYQHDLVGCAVQTSEGVAVGAVVAVEGSGAGSRLVVQASHGGEVLIPFAEEMVAVHLGARTIIVNAPDGLLDLNVTRKQRF